MPELKQKIKKMALSSKLSIIVSIIALAVSVKSCSLAENANSIAQKTQELEFNPYIEAKFQTSNEYLPSMWRHAEYIKKWEGLLRERGCNTAILPKQYLFCEVTNYGEGIALNISVPYKIKILEKGTDNAELSDSFEDEFVFWNVKPGESKISNYAIDVTYFPNVKIEKSQTKIEGIPQRGEKTDITNVLSTAFQNPDIERFFK